MREDQKAEIRAIVAEVLRDYGLYPRAPFGRREARPQQPPAADPAPRIPV